MRSFLSKFSRLWSPRLCTVLEGLESLGLAVTHPLFLLSFLLSFLPSFLLSFLLWAERGQGFLGDTPLGPHEWEELPIA